MMDRKRKLESESEVLLSNSSQQLNRIDKNFAFELVRNGNLNEIIKYSDQINLLIDRDGEKQITYLHKVLEDCYCDGSFNKIKDTLQYILSKAPQLTDVCHKGFTPETPIMMACRLNIYYEAIKLLLEANPESVNVTHSADNFTPLMNLVCLQHPWKDEVNKKAVLHKSSNVKNALQSVELLLESGANINAEDSEGRNVLQNILFSEANNEISKKERRLNINSYSNWSEQMVKILLKNGSKLRSCQTDNHALSYVNSITEAELIINHDPSEINCKDKKGWSPLHHVVSRCDEDTCDIIEYLIDNGAKIEENRDIIHVAKDELREYSLVSKLLKRIPSYDVNTKDKYGQTLLIFFIEEHKAVKELLELGADVSIVDNAGNSALSCVNLNYDNAINIIKLLLEKGADPCQNFNPITYCILLKICERLLKTNIHFDEWFELFSAIINLPQMRDSTMPQHIKDIYICLFKIIFNFSYVFDSCWSESLWKIHLKCISQLLSKICTSNEGVHSLLVPCMVTPSQFSVDHVLTFHCPEEVDPFTYGILRASENLETFRSEKRLEEYVIMMIDSKLLPSKTPENCITSLTMLFLVLQGKTSVKKEVRLNLCKKLIDFGVNVESNSLIIQEVTATVFESRFNCSVLSNLKTEYYLPDVLLLAFLFKYNECIDILVSHWWAPPLALFAFHPAPTLADFGFWVPIFLKYSKIPHGTDLFQRVKFHVSSFESIVRRHEVPPTFQHLWISCMEFLNTPQPLMELCILKIRQPLAKEATKTDTSLPILMQEVLPDYAFPANLQAVIKH